MRTPVAVVGAFVLGAVIFTSIVKGTSERLADAAPAPTSNASLVESWDKVVAAIEANESAVTESHRKWYRDLRENATDPFQVHGDFYSIDVCSEEMTDFPSLDLIEGIVGIQVNSKGIHGEEVEEHRVKFHPRDKLWVLHSIETVSYRKDEPFPRRTRSTSIEECSRALREVLKVDGIELR
jgi:hypothetical protein